jgi:hypothetical protein
MKDDSSYDMLFEGEFASALLSVYIPALRANLSAQME